jgi:hypothetical protein
MSLVFQTAPVKPIAWPRRALLRAASQGDMFVKTLWGIAPSNLDVIDSLPAAREIDDAPVAEKTSSTRDDLWSCGWIDEMGLCHNSSFPVL